MKKLLKEFKDFALKGNVIDLAVGMVIGSAFTAIVTGLVNDLIMPLISMLTAGFVDLSSASFYINQVEFKYGDLLNAIINFVIIAVVLFLMVKAINKLRSLRKKEEEKPAAKTTRICPYCRTEIHIEACRCPNCTSILDEKKNIK